MKLLMIFIVLNIFNVIIQTAKSICTIKCGKVAASLVNALAYGLYTVVIVYTMCDLPLLLKALIVAACNLVGVFVVKLIEEKAQKDKLWKVEATVSAEKGLELKDWAKLLSNQFNLSFNYIEAGKYWVFNFFCSDKEASANIKNLLKEFDAKYFVSETKIL